jgi:hypothetical protein
MRNLRIVNIFTKWMGSTIAQAAYIGAVGALKSTTESKLDRQHRDAPPSQNLPTAVSERQ